MARDKLTEYSATASENTVCGDVNIAENSALPSDMNNFAREVMSHLKAFSDGTDAIDALTVDGSVTVADKVIHSGDTDTFMDFNDANNIRFVTNNTAKINIQPSAVVVNEASNDIDFRVEGNSATHLIFADAGNDKVGFGASVPTQRVSIEGTANDQSSELKLTATAVASGYLGCNSNGLNIGTDSHGLVFKTGVTGGGSVGNTGTERMRISSSGDLILGTTSTIGPAQFNVDGSSQAGIGIRAGNGTSGYFNQVLFANNGNTALIGSIQRVNNASVQYNTTSDARLKENIADMTGAITRVKALKPKRYSWIAEDLDAADQDGFLAHEAQTVVPNAVSGTQNEVDDDGNAVYMQMDYSRVVPVLTAALKEAIAKIETLETKVAALEAAD